MNTLKPILIGRYFTIPYDQINDVQVVRTGRLRCSCDVHDAGTIETIFAVRVNTVLDCTPCELTVDNAITETAANNLAGGIKNWVERTKHDIGSTATADYAAVWALEKIEGRPGSDLPNGQNFPIGLDIAAQHAIRSTFTENMISAG